MEKGIRQKRYQKFTKNGKEWTEWFDWSGEEPEWQLKGRLRNEYRTIYPSGGSFLDGEANSKAGANEAATANGNGLQRLYIFPFGVYITPSGLTKAVNYHTKVLDFAFPELTRINHNSPRIILNYTGIILKRLKRAFLSGKTLIFPPLEDI